MAGSKRKWESHDFEEEDLSVYPGEKKKIKSDLDHKQQNIIDDEPWPPWPWLTEAAFATAELGTRYMHIETGQKMMSLHNTLSDIISELSEDVIIHKGKVKQKVILAYFYQRFKDYRRLFSMYVLFVKGLCIGL